MKEYIFRTWWTRFKKHYPGWATQNSIAELSQTIFEAGHRGGEARIKFAIVSFRQN